MADQGFSERQVEQLTELLHTQREGILDDVKTYVDQRFIEERAYYRQLIRDELTDIKEQLARVEETLKRVDERTDEDVTAALNDVAAMKRRLEKAEHEIAELKAT